MPSYGVNEIIGASMWAKKSVNVKSQAFDDSPVIRVAKKDEFIGTVHSYLLPTTGRSQIHWMFYASDGKPFYVRHDENAFTLTGVGEVYGNPEEEESGSSGWGWLIDTLGNAVNFVLRPKYDVIGKYVVLGVMTWGAFKYGPGIVDKMKKRTK